MPQFIAVSGINDSLFYSSRMWFVYLKSRQIVAYSGSWWRRIENVTSYLSPSACWSEENKAQSNEGRETYHFQGVPITPKSCVNPYCLRLPMINFTPGSCYFHFDNAETELQRTDAEVILGESIEGLFFFLFTSHHQMFVIYKMILSQLCKDLAWFHTDREIKAKRETQAVIFVLCFVPISGKCYIKWKLDPCSSSYCGTQMSWRIFLSKSFEINGNSKSQTCIHMYMHILTLLNFSSFNVI